MAKFTKGNPGKPKGSRNRRSLTRSKIASILNDESTWRKFMVELKKLKGRAYVDALTKLFEFDTPKYSAINFSLQGMSDEDLRFLITKLKQDINYDHEA